VETITTKRPRLAAASTVGDGVHTLIYIEVA
jgi:hypothetical protein